MRAFDAWRDGIRRVASAPLVVVVVWCATTLVSVPLTVVVRADIARSFGASLASTAAARGMISEWMQDVGAGATGLTATLRPTIVGFAAVLDNLSTYLDRARPPAAIAGAVAIYAVVWAFLTGGVIERYAHGRARSVRGFLAACGRYFFRFLRLTIVTALVFAALVGVHRVLFDTVYPRVVNGLAAERTAFFVRVAFYLVFLLVLAAVNIVTDFAKVRAVVEDRRSMLVAIAASWRFVARHRASAVCVYLLDAAAFVLTLSAYLVAAPAAGGAGVMVWAAFLIGQAYIAGRLCVRLLFVASEIALFQQDGDGPQRLGTGA